MHVSAVDGEAWTRRHFLAAGRASEMFCLLVQNESRFIDEGPITVVAARLLLFGTLLFLFPHLCSMC